MERELMIYDEIGACRVGAAFCPSPFAAAARDAHVSFSPFFMELWTQKCSFWVVLLLGGAWGPGGPSVSACLCPDTKNWCLSIAFSILFSSFPQPLPVLLQWDSAPQNLLHGPCPASMELSPWNLLHPPCHVSVGLSLPKAFPWSLPFFSRAQIPKASPMVRALLCWGNQRHFGAVLSSHPSVWHPGHRQLSDLRNHSHLPSWKMSCRDTVSGIWFQLGLVLAQCSVAPWLPFPSRPCSGSVGGCEGSFAVRLLRYQPCCSFSAPWWKQGAPGAGRGV